MTDDELVAAYAEIAALSGAVCAQCADPPHPPYRCCSQLYCWVAREAALERWGVTLTRTHHEALPYMGAQGCTVAPHLRSLCSLAVCKDELARQPTAVQERYWTLREAIEEAEEKRSV